MLVLYPGEKIKKIRKELKLSQKELSKDILSLSMLSYVERGKFKLEKEIAKKLVEKLNYYVENPSEKIDYEFILEEPEKQINKIIISEIKNLKNINLEKINEFRAIFEKFKFYNEHIKLFFIIASHFKRTNIKMAELLYEEILEISINKNLFFILLNIILELQRIYSNQGSFNKNLILYKRVNNFLNKFSLIIVGDINYNFALAFETNKNFDKAIILYKESMLLLKKKRYILC